MANGNMTIDGLLDTDSEGALEMIENIACAGNHYHLAANLPNVGQIANLPYGAIVETPVMVDGAGIHPVHVGALPESIAELCRRELELHNYVLTLPLKAVTKKHCSVYCLIL